MVSCPDLSSEHTQGSEWAKGLPRDGEGDVVVGLEPSGVTDNEL